MYKCKFPLPRHLSNVSVELHVPADLPPGKEAVTPIEQEGRWASEQVWTTWR